MKRFALLILSWGLFFAVIPAHSDWTPAKRLTWTSGHSFGPAVAVDSNNRIHVVWYDNTSGNYEIYYKKSTNGGTSWSAIRRLTWAAGWSDNPALAIDSTNTIHLVWRDDPSGNVEIYYKHGN